MALWAYALRTVAQVKATAWPLGATGSDSIVEDCINEASEVVEKAWGRHIVSRGSLTEYHPRIDTTGPGSLYVPEISGPYFPVSGTPLPLSIGPELYLNEYPIVSVTTVHEDSARAYGADTLLTANTDYVVSKPTGKLVRVAGAAPSAWISSWRAVKVVYVAGYQNTAGNISGADAVPPTILRVFDELVGWMIRQRISKEVGLQSVSDALGNRSFSGPAYITPQMEALLMRSGACVNMRMRTGERDS